MVTTRYCSNVHEMTQENATRKRQCVPVESYCSLSCPRISNKLVLNSTKAKYRKKGEGVERSRRKVEESLRSRKKLVIFPVPQVRLGPIPLVPNANKEIKRSNCPDYVRISD